MESHACFKITRTIQKAMGVGLKISLDNWRRLGALQITPIDTMDDVVACDLGSHLIAHVTTAPFYPQTPLIDEYMH